MMDTEQTPKQQAMRKSRLDRVFFTSQDSDMKTQPISIDYLSGEGTVSEIKTKMVRLQEQKVCLNPFALTPLPSALSCS